MINTERYLEFIVNHKLAQSQFILLLLLYKGRSDLMKKYKQVFPADDGSFIGQGLIDDLVHRGFLIKGKNYDGVGNSKTLEVGIKFTKAFVDKFTAIEELIELYPGMMIKNGVRYPLTLIDDVKFSDIYWRKINGDIEEHNLVKEDIKYMISNDLICGKLESFITSKYWAKIREIKNGILNPQNVKVNEEFL